MTTQTTPKRISIIGMGYVGCVLAACWASEGHVVIGMEQDYGRLERMKAGEWPGLDADVAAKLRQHPNQLFLTNSTNWAVKHSDITFICVGTPQASDDSGLTLDLDQVRRALAAVGDALRDKCNFHVVAIKSTLMPGVFDDLIKPWIERASGKKAGVDFGLCVNPEFIREGTALKDFYQPPFTVVGVEGGEDAPANRTLINQLEDLYSWCQGEFIVTEPGEAEMLKLTCNAFHALKVCFANEIGLLCRRVGVDSLTVMDIFTRDRRLNISPAYLRPGFAFGGSCLEKDVTALTDMAETADLATPVLKAILPSNVDIIDLTILAIREAKPKTVGVIGMTFKPGTTDERNSPGWALARMLVNEQTYPIICAEWGRPSVREALACDVVVLVTGHPLVQQMRPEQVVIDVANSLPAGDYPCKVVRLT